MFLEIEGVKSEDAPRVGAIPLKFEDENHFTSTCESGGKTEGNHEPMTMRYTRVKK